MAQSMDKGDEGKGKAKAKAGKKRKEPPPKVYTLICGSEVAAREAAYGQRLAELRACLNIVEDAARSVENAFEKEKRKTKWERYLRCDKYPKANKPPMIRLFFSKMRFFEDANVIRTIDWQLLIDERSILTQDIDRIDRTRKTLIERYRHNIGDEYNDNINQALQMHALIGHFIDDNPKAYSTAPNILVDLLDLEKLVQHEVSEFFNRYTYRVICGGSSYLDSIDGQTCEYFYEGTQFKIHIWALKNVPILFDFLPEPFMLAHFHLLNVQIQIPFSLLETNLTIRGIHFDFDHFTQHAKSFKQEITEAALNLNAAIPDLYMCLINEWNTQQNMQQKVKSDMIAARQAYEEKLAEDEAEAKKKKGGGDDKAKKKPKPKKNMREPQDMPPNCVPDVYAEFLAAEQKEYEDFINENYHPDILKLTEDEVNLRKYFIVGGIYQFYFVGKPINFTFEDFNMTWHVNNAQLYIRNNVFVVDDGKPISLARSSIGISTQLPAVRSSASRAMGMERKPVSPFFIITFELPDYMCRWGDDPVACHFEADLQGILETIAQDATAEAPAGGPGAAAAAEGGPGAAAAAEGGPGAAGKPPGAAGDDPGMVTDALTGAAPPSEPKHDLIALPTFTSMSDVLHRPRSMSSMSNMPLQPPSRSASLSNVFRSMISSFNFHRTHPTEVVMEDFRLDLPLTRTQIRNLARYCLPRIISSYRLPVESRDDVERSSKKKRKSALKRMDKVQPVEERNFFHGEDKQPERMFPQYPPFDKHWVDANPTEWRHGEPQTFFDLLTMFNIFKNINSNRYQKVLNIPRYEQRLLCRKPQRHREESQEILLSARSSRTNRPRASTKRASAMSRAFRGHKGHQKGAKLRASHIEELPTYLPDDDEPADEECEEEQELHSFESDSNDMSIEENDNAATFKYSHWTTAHIVEQIFDREKKTITIYTDRLGTIGFAYNRYEHFPFQDWHMEADPQKPDEIIRFTLDTRHVRVKLRVTADGYTGYVTDFAQGFVRNPVKYLVIDQPTKLIELKKLFVKHNLNIFTESDACFYIKDGYFSVKHLATEMHTYSCMAINAGIFTFSRSIWNRLATRRDIVMKVVLTKDKDDLENHVEIRITPDAATFVLVTELCSDDLNVFKLSYTNTWRNIEYYGDLHQLIQSIDATALDYRIKNPKLICNLRNFLSEIRPLSFA